MSTRGVELAICGVLGLAGCGANEPADPEVFGTGTTDLDSHGSSSNATTVADPDASTTDDETTTVDGTAADSLDSGGASSDTGSDCEGCGCRDAGTPLDLSCDATALPMGAGQHQWGSSYTNWTSTTAGVVFEQRLRIVQPAYDSFHTQTFTLTGASGGYIGLQTTNIGGDGSIASHVRFSIWDTLAADGPGCIPFGGEGIGYTCVIDPYPVTMGVFYTLRIERAEPEADGVWWEASVTNDATCETQTIGRIRVTHVGDQQLIASSLNFSEYFGPRAADCHGVPQSIAEWTAPEITDENGATVADPWASFTKAEPEQPCSDAGVDASGEVVALGDTTVYRMVNGSIVMCQ